jgi:hypothetical protein
MSRVRAQTVVQFYLAACIAVLLSVNSQDGSKELEGGSKQTSQAKFTAHTWLLTIAAAACGLSCGAVLYM